MKVLIYSDIHISQDSSIVKGFNGKYSTRLNHIIDSINWAERLAEDLKCNFIVNLGDTFDKPVINAIEATAIQEIKWAKLHHFVLVGNHDSNVASLEYSSSAIFRGLENFEVIEKPIITPFTDFDVLFLPYILEDNRKKLVEYWSCYNSSKKHIIFSHNDIAGFNFGKFVSTEGFEIEDIYKYCDLYLNGHLHNSSWLNDKILNVGNLCGQNFSEDALKYKHGAWLLDTDTLKIEFYENPYSLNFYKVNINSENIELPPIKNSVVLINCDAKYVSDVKEKLKENLDIVASKVLVYNKESKTPSINAKINKIDPWTLLTNYLEGIFGNNEILKDELSHLHG